MPKITEYNLHITGPDFEKVFPIRDEQLSIGRQTGNDLVLDNPEVSRRHAILIYRQAECTITDVGSSNGTRVDGEKITPDVPFRLNPASVIKIGPFSLTIEQITIDIPEPAPPEIYTPVEQPEEKLSLEEIPAPPMETPPPKPPASPSPIPVEGPAIPQGLSRYSQKLIQYLPGIYHTDFMSRFLGIFEATLIPLEWSIDNFDLFLDPGTAPEGFLPWLANWFEIAFNPTWTESQRRLLLKEASAIYSRRGTRWALSRLLEIYTGKQPTIIDIGEKLDPHTFTVILPISEKAINREVIERIIDSNKPAHTTYKLELKPQ
jgi:phage tail-like protein